MIKTITAVVCVATACVLVGYDIFAAVKAGPSGTISDVIRGVAATNPIVPFAFGILMGHFFWSK